MKVNDGQTGSDETPASSKSNDTKPKKNKKSVIKKSPLKKNDSTHEENCECKKWISGQSSLECENCKLFWHFCCVGLKGLTEEAAELLEHWLCPNCFFSPHAKGVNTTADGPDEKSVRNLLKAELHIIAPAIRATVEDALRGSQSPCTPSSEAVKNFDDKVDKAVNKAVKLYSEITASSQKKVIDEASLAKSSKKVVEEVARHIDANHIERDRRRLNVCVMKVPESSKSVSKERENADYNYCIDTLKIDPEDIVSCHRAGAKKPDFCRPLIIKMAREKDVDFWTLSGRGYNTGCKSQSGECIYINKDLCKADREANFRVRKANVERKNKRVAEKKKEEEEKKKDEEKKNGVTDPTKNV